MTVTASGLTELRGRERVEISWSGAHPSGGRAANPYGEKGLAQEYPVVVMQCRGVDDPDASPEEQLAPGPCWPSPVAPRSQHPIGRASGRERACQDVWISGVAG